MGADLPWSTACTSTFERYTLAAVQVASLQLSNRNWCSKLDIKAICTILHPSKCRIVISRLDREEWGETNVLVLNRLCGATLSEK